MPRLYLVRHAKAVDRDDWRGPDHKRPLSRKGERRAAELARAFGGAPLALYASPALRCQQTLAPLAQQLDVEIRVDVRLHQADAEAQTGADLARCLASFCAAVARAGQAAIACSHGDAIPAFLEGLGVHSPECRTGSAWELELGADGQVRRAVYYDRGAEPVRAWDNPQRA